MGAVDEGRDHPVPVAELVGPAVSFVVTSRESETVVWSDGFAGVRLTSVHRSQKNRERKALERTGG
jgi:hypothetical protein